MALSATSTVNATGPCTHTCSNPMSQQPLMLRLWIQNTFVNVDYYGGPVDALCEGNIERVGWLVKLVSFPARPLHCLQHKMCHKTIAVMVNHTLIIEVL